MTPVLAITTGRAIAAALALAWLAVLIWRRDRIHGERLIVSVIGIAVLALMASGLLTRLPAPDAVLEDLANVLGKWTYLLVGVLAFLETGAFVGLIVPGEATVIVGGVVAGQGEIDIRLLIGLVWVAAYLGDTVSFLVGARLGRGFLLKHGPRVKITEERLVQVERYMDQHGGKTILIGRFIGLLRALAPFIAGASRMPYRRFLPYDVLGSGLWAACFCLLGYFFSQNLEAVIHWAERGVLIFSFVAAAVVGLVLLIRHFRDPVKREQASAWLDAQALHPRYGPLVRPVRWVWLHLVLPVSRFLSGPLTFLLNRVTPGGLGIEFTTATAVLAVAGYAFYYLLVAALNWPDNEFVMQLNNTAFDVAASFRNDTLTEVVKVVTKLGALPVAGTVVAVACAVCLSRRRFPEALTLAVSFGITVAIVHLTKSWTDVPRPSGTLVATENASFPSGHAAYAVAYVAVALALTRVGLLAQISLALIGTVIGGAIAASRVYLRAHYLSDALAGTALGFAVFAFVASLALLFVHLRQRARDPSTSRGG